MKENIIKKLIIYSIFTLIMFVITLTYALLLYKKVVSNDETNIFIITYIIGGIMFFILGLIKGLIINKNGLLEGLLSSTFIIFIILLLNFILKRNFTSLNIIKIIVYISLGCVGGILGVNLRK